MKWYVLIFCAFTIASCEEDLSIVDAIELGEYEGNFIDIRPIVKEVSSSTSVLGVEDGIVELSKNDAIVQSLEPGDIISNFDSSNGAIAFYTKVAEIIDTGNSIKIQPAEVSIPEVFRRIHVDTRVTDNSIAVVRDIFSAGIVYTPTVPLIAEVKSFGTVDGNLEFTYLEGDDSFIVVDYDEDNSNAASLRLQIQDARLSGNIQYDYTGQILTGIKKDKLLGNILPMPTPPPLAAVGLGLFLDFKVAAGFKFKGSLESPNVSFDTGTFSVDVSLSESPLFAENDISGFNPQAQSSGEWMLGGSGSFDVNEGAEITIRPIAVTSIKAGVELGLYAKVDKGIAKPGETADDAPIDVETGLYAKAIFSGSMITDNFTLIGGLFSKVGFFFESPTYRLPTFQESYSEPNACEKVNGWDVMISPTNLELNVPCQDCTSQDRYRIWFNDNLLTDGDGITERYFEYNRNYLLPLEYALEYDNNVILQDTAQRNCMLCDRKPLSAIDNNRDFCDDTFTDPRNGDVYCLKTIGGQTWMTENLRYEGPIGDIGLLNTGVSPEDQVVYGRYYTGAEVFAGQAPNEPSPLGVEDLMGGTMNRIQGICPDGFHLPTTQEYAALVAAVGDADNLKAKSRYYWPIGNLPEEPSFNLVSSGFFVSSTIGSTNTKKSAALWTSNQIKYRSFSSADKLYPISFTIKDQDNRDPDIVTITEGSAPSTSAFARAFSQNSVFPCRCVMD